MCSASIDASRHSGTRRSLLRWLQSSHSWQGPAEAGLVLLLLVLSLFLRLRGLDTTGIWNDQAFTLGTAMRWVNGGDMPLAANISSLGFVNPPMIEYLYAVALWVGSDIISVAVLTLIAGIVAVAAAGCATLRVFGKLAAFWTVLTFAVNPWSVYYSQLIWNQTMVPVFASLTFACLLVYFAREQRPVYLILSFVWAACMSQVHPGSSIQLFTMGLVFLIYRRRLKPWPFVAGIASFALLYTPYLLYERGVEWRDLNVIADLITLPARYSTASILVSFDLLQTQALLSEVKGVRLFDCLASLLLASGIAITLWVGLRAIRRPSGDAERNSRVTGLTILVLWFLVPILFYLRSSDLVYVQPYYLIGQLPTHFVFIGVALATLQGHARSLLQGGQGGTGGTTVGMVFWFLPAAPLLALLLWQFSFNLQFQEARFQNRTAEAQIRQIRSAVTTGNQLLAENRNCQFVVVSEGHSVEQSYLSLLREFTVPERVLLTDGRLAVPMPAPCAHYLDALPGSRASNWLTETATQLPGTEIQAPGATWQFYELDDLREVTLREGLTRVNGLAQWVNGVSLDHYDRAPLEPGVTMPLTMYWFVESSPPEVVYHFGTYLLDMSNQLIAQYDGPGFDSIQWRKGDSFITWAEVPVPNDLQPGDYQLAVAYYSWPAVERVDLRSGGNTAILERIRYDAP